MSLRKGEFEAMRLKAIWIILVLAALTVGCGEGSFNEGEDYGNLLDGPEGLTLTEEEHEIGWGQSECTICHNLDNIHLVNRTDIPIDIEAIHELALEDGTAGCA